MARKTVAEELAALKATFEERTKNFCGDISEVKENVKEIKQMMAERNSDCNVFRGECTKQVNKRLTDLERGERKEHKILDILGKIIPAALSAASLIISAWLASGGLG